MAEKNLKFLVVFFSKNRRLFMSLAALALIVAAVWAIAAFTDWLIVVNQDPSVPWSVVFADETWQGTAMDNTLPRYFVAGGTSFDKEVLVDGWGMSAEMLTPVDYMEDLGLHILFGEVTKVTYSEGRLNVYVSEKQAGYELVTLSKGYLQEGDLQIAFMDAEGASLGYEEEYIYSVPLQFTLVDSGDAESKASIFMEQLNAETLPVLTDYDLSLINDYPGAVLLYIQGGEVATIQRSDTTIRIYTDSKPVYQVIALDPALLKSGGNTVKLIDSSDLNVETQLILQISN